MRTKPGVLSSELIDQAVEHVKATALALGFAAAEPPELVPDPHVEELNNSAGYAAHLYQQYRGIPVFQMERTVRFDSDGAVLDIAGKTVPLSYDLEIAPAIDARAAVKAAAEYLASPNDGATPDNDQFGQPIPAHKINVSGYTPTVLAGFPLPAQPTVLDKGPFGELIPAHLVLFYIGPDTRLGWHMIFTMPSLQRQYVVIVSADGKSPKSEILYCQDTSFSVRARGPVYTHNPGIRDREPVNFPRLIADYPFENAPTGLPEGFPSDWCDDDKKATRGNNTIAVLGEGD
jgi:extracellular elastinolytic metalloproteinase